MYFRGFTVNDDNADTVDRLSLYEDLNFIEVVPVVGLEPTRLLMGPGF